MARPIFHLSIPVSDLAAAKRFYEGVLGASVGRQNEEWLDVLVWGHQITLHDRPDDVLPAGKQGHRHFGVILPWADWEREAARIARLGVSFVEAPAIKLAGTEDEHGKFYLRDPSGNLIEVKTYRNAARTLHLADDDAEASS
jgi:extradiol dioxygenase family protein